MKVRSLEHYSVTVVDAEPWFLIPPNSSPFAIYGKAVTERYGVHEEKQSLRTTKETKSTA